MPVYWYLAVATEVMASIVGSCFYRNIKQKFLFLYFFVLLGASTDILNIVSIKFSSHSNLWVSHIYFPFEFLLLALFYRQHITTMIRQRWIIMLISILMTYAVINAIFIQSVNEYSHVRIFSSILLVLFSLIYFYKVMVEVKIRRLFADSLIWANVAVLFFYSTIFFYNLLSNLILDYSYELAKHILTFNGYMIVLFYIFITIAFGMEGRQQIKGKSVSLKRA